MGVKMLRAHANLSESIEIIGIGVLKQIKRLCRLILIAAASHLIFTVPSYSFHLTNNGSPGNDACESASVIEIPDNGFGTGVFISETVDVTEATSERFEYFDPVQISAVNNKKSIWYTFVLPTAREVSLELKQPGIDIASDGAGFTTYLTDDCVMGDKEIVAAKLTPVNKFGSTYNPCLDPGRYLVQVSTRANASGPVFLKLTVGPSFKSDLTDNIAYDRPSDAFDFGTMDVNVKTITYDFGCHSIDNFEENNGLPVPLPATYTQSTWHVFTTDDFFDVFSIIVEPGPPVGAVPPENLVFKLFEGDVRQKPYYNLPAVDKGTVMKSFGSMRAREFTCNSTLKPNKTYSFQLLFPTDYYGDNIQVRVSQWGVKNTAAPFPLQHRVDPASDLGVLPGSPAGTVTAHKDYFSCNSYVPDNPCGLVQPAGGVMAAKIRFDMAVWTSFELERISDVTITFGRNTPWRFIRLFNKPFGTDPGTIDPVRDLVAESPEFLHVNCLSPDKYSIQILTISFDASVAPRPTTDYGVLGREIEIKINVKDTRGSNRFSMTAPGAVDPVNDLKPLPNGIMVSAQRDTFFCGSAVMPDQISCEAETSKASYRIFNIGDGNHNGAPDSGYLHITGMNTTDLRYALFLNDLSSMAQNQDVFRNAGATIKGTTNYLEGCISSSSDSTNYYCVTPGKYTFVTLASHDQMGIPDQPQFRFSILKTKYARRSKAENLGDIKKTINSGVISDTDTFSCLNNPAVLGGLKPTGGPKLIYRQFYLSESRMVSLSSPTGHFLNLFMGKARDEAAVLEPWNGRNMMYTPWQESFTTQTTHPCYPLTPGWYTVVSYGSGPSYDDPSLNGTIGDPGDAGEANSITITLEKLHEEPCDCPSKACLVNNGEPVTWDLTARSEDFPNTSKLYHLDTTYFGCTPDTPWTKHPIVPCDPEDLWVLYYVFKLGEPSYVAIRNIPSKLGTKIYPFDVRKDSTRMMTTEPIFPCSDPGTDEIQICNLQPGTYTLVIFAGPGDPYFVSPEIYVERIGKSRFDHAGNAYDFGMVPSDNKKHWGMVGDVHPVNPNLPPSSDIIYCSTGAQPTDPTDGICDGAYNPYIYKSVKNNVLYESGAGESEEYILRNLWYTFVLSGTGQVILELDHFPDTISMYRPLLSIYQSNVDGTIPFKQLISSGGVDSTIWDGLSFMKCNSDSLCNGLRSKTLTFEKSACTENTVRYYLLISLWNTAVPNQQVSLSIQYEGIPIDGVKYDHYSTASQIKRTNQPNLINGAFTSGEGIFTGAPARLECATRDSKDPLKSDCYSRSVWYKFTTENSGSIRVAHESAGDPDSRSASTAMKVYRETRSGDSASLAEIDMTMVELVSPETGVAHAWHEGTGVAGTYYIFWTDCSEEFDIYKTYSPVVWLVENPGDFCSDAIEISINGAGTAEGTLTIDGHTIGTDFGEDGSYMGCLFGPESYKSSWFKLDISSDQRLDVTFDLTENTTASADQVLYRILYGDCSAMTAGPCNNNANTIFSLSCMESGDNYFIQVVSPNSAKGEIKLIIRTEETLHQDCVPINPIKPVANFDPAYTCFEPSVNFMNKSTQGEDIQYLWEFPDGETSSEFSPTYTFPQADSTLVFNVSLIVTHKHFGLSDSITKPVAIPPASIFHFEDTIVCTSDATFLNVSIPRAKYLWQDGSSKPVIEVKMPGLYWVEVTAFDCTIRDSVWVDFYLCDKEIIDTSLCKGSLFYNGVIHNDTTILVEEWTGPASGQMIVYRIHVLDSVLIYRNISICEGDHYSVGNSVYTTSGIYTNVFQTRDGCDSTIITHLKVKPAPSPEITGDPYFCKGSSSTLEVKEQFQSYLWTTNRSTGPSIEVFSQGVYQVVVTDSLGCQGTVSYKVYPPIEINTHVDIHLKNNGQHISCEGAADGEVTILAAGGRGPYIYHWDNNTDSQTSTGLAAGSYSGTVTDQTGCSAEFSFELENAQPMSLDVSVMQTVCHGENNGIIQVDVSGVTGPCQYSLNEEPLQNDNIFHNLSAGLHTVYVLDKSGCDAETTITLEESEPIHIEIYPAQAEVDLGKSMDIQVAIYSGDIEEISWDPAEEIDCESCQVITVTPMENTMYTVHVMDENNCMETAYSEITVNKNRQVFIPNSFTPNNDGLNDRLTVFSGSNIENVRQFKVFDRWGSLVFDIRNIPPNNENIGWDGTVDGYQLPPAVYIYFAELEYIDNHRELIKGDVTLIR